MGGLAGAIVVFTSGISGPEGKNPGHGSGTRRILSRIAGNRPAIPRLLLRAGTDCLPLPDPPLVSSDPGPGRVTGMIA